MRLKGSTVLITGGSSGIGLELLKQFSEQGAKDIIITGRDLSKLVKVKKGHPFVHIFQSDVSKPDQIDTLYDNIIEQFPDLNILINNAGIMRKIDLQDASMDITDITKEIDINLSGTVMMVHRFLPHLKKKDSAAIINMTSGLAFVPFPISPIYSATKSGLHAYTRVLRLQLKKTNVKVFELAAPGTKTDAMEDFKEFVDEKQNMDVDKMVQTAIKGILNDTMEIKPGSTKFFKLMSRLAPNFSLNYLNKKLEKAKQASS